MRRNFVNALMREISRTPIYRVRCYKLICLRNRANPVESHAFHPAIASDANDLKKLKNSRFLGFSIFFALYTLLSLQLPYSKEL